MKNDGEGGGQWEMAEAAAAAPLLLALGSCASQNVAPFHFPGHRRGAAAPPSLSRLLGPAAFAHDLPELPELDNLFAPEHAIAQAQSKAASLFGADATHFLVNGSTCGIQAAVMSTCSPGDILVLPRNSHISAVSAMVLSGALPKYLMPSYDPEWDIAHGIDPQDVEAALVEVEMEGKGRVGAVLITSPTYFGVCSNVREIAQICHERGVPLIVDEAHGAHFGFHPELPETALEQGADVAVQSTHKVLNSLTQSAMLHVQGDMVKRDMLARCLQTLQSSSPSYLLLASLDAARELMSSSNDLLVQALELARTGREALTAVSGLRVLGMKRIEEMNSRGAIAIDPLRITVGLWDLGLSGFEVDDILRVEHLVVAELPSLRSITFAVSTGTTREDVQRLIKSFQALSQSRQPSFRENSLSSAFSNVSMLLEQSMALSPREAFFSATQKVDAKDALGCTSAELICPYPPGIPMLVPGEVISPEAIAYLKAVVGKGGIITGASDPSLNSMLICRREK